MQHNNEAIYSLPPLSACKVDCISMTVCDFVCMWIFKTCFQEPNTDRDSCNIAELLLQLLYITAVIVISSVIALTSKSAQASLKLSSLECFKTTHYAKKLTTNRYYWDLVEITYELFAAVACCRRPKRFLESDEDPPAKKPSKSKRAALPPVPKIFMNNTNQNDTESDHSESQEASSGDDSIKLNTSTSHRAFDDAGTSSSPMHAQSQAQSRRSVDDAASSSSSIQLQSPLSRAAGNAVGGRQRSVAMHQQTGYAGMIVVLCCDSTKLHITFSISAMWFVLSICVLFHEIVYILFTYSLSQLHVCLLNFYAL